MGCTLAHPIRLVGWPKDVKVLLLLLQGDESSDGLGA